VKLLVSVTVLSGLLMGLLGAALAQPEGTGQAPARYSDTVNLEEFGPPPAGSREDTVSAPLMVTLAYALIWVLAAGFMWSIWRRSRALMSELHAAHQRLEALDERLRAQVGREGTGG
jgi:hypothetical protein